MGDYRGLKDKQFSEALQKFSETTNSNFRNIRRVRIVETLNTIPIKDGSGKIYKGYKGDSNHCIEVWKLADGSWKSIALSTFDANKNGLGHTRPHPTAKLLMRLFKKDAVALEHPNLGPMQMIIQKFTKAGITLYPACEGNVDKSIELRMIPQVRRYRLGTFKDRKLRKIGIDVFNPSINSPV